MWSERDIELDSRYGRDPNSTLLVVDDHTVGAMDEGGALSTWDLPPSSQAWSVRGLVGAEVIINSYEGAFLVDRDGNARRIHQGTALATNGHEILLATCDDALLCRPVVVDPSGAVVETLPPFPEGYALGSAALGPDGTDILVEGDRWERGELDRGVFRHTAQGWVASGTGSGLGVGTAVWIPGTGTAVWWQPDVMPVNALPAEGEPVRFRLSTVDGSSTWGLVAVTTIDLLPEEWRAELAG